KLATSTDGRNLHSLAPETNRASIDEENALVTCKNLLKTLRNTGYSLNAALSYPIMDQRVMTLYKESSQHIYNIHKVTLKALQMAHKSASSSNDFQSSLYGLSTPYIRSQLSRFVIASLEKWAAASNLDFFLDDPHSSALDPPIPFPSSSGNTTSATSSLIPGQTKKIVTSLTKEQLLVDLEFEKHIFADDPRIDLMNNKNIIPITLHQVKINFGEKEEQSGSSGHPEGSLCLLLEERTRNFLRDLGCAPNVDWSQVDPVKVERSAAELRNVLEEINWIVDTAKREAEVNSAKESETWDCIQTIADKASKVLQIEAKLVETDNNLEPVAIDTLALRSSGVHFPFLQSFSLGFLLYLPPLAYLTLLRSYSQQDSKDTTASSNYPSDIPIGWTRKLLIDGPARERLQIPIATLAYDPHSKLSTSHTNNAMEVDESGQPIAREHIASRLEDVSEWN
ncbi:3635_t:CDS:2, partial [Acaulospora colombiana]